MPQVLNLGDVVVVQAQLPQLSQARQVVYLQQPLEAEAQRLYLPVPQVAALLVAGLHPLIELQPSDKVSSIKAYA